jgi:pimeloyl-ACP methyl ester carboxylesterase
VFRHEFADVDGVRMHYVTGGTGSPGTAPPVLLHGWPQTWFEWRPVLPALAAGRTVIAVDLPGIGDSQGAPPDYAKATLARFVHGLVADRLGHRSIDLVAHDLGAGVGYQYAAQHPGEVRRLALMDYPLPGPAVPGQGQPPAAVLNLAWHFGFHSAPGHMAEQMVDDEVGTYLREFYPEVAFQGRRDAVPEQAAAEFTRTYSRPQQLTGGFELYRTLPQDVRDNIASAATPLPMPVLVVTGQRDQTAGLDRLEFLAGPVRAVATDVTAVDIPGAGHWLSEEQPAALTEQILRFLN